MEAFENIHILAIRYFNGVINRNEELILADFVHANEHNRNLLHAWEKEWAAGHIADMSSDEAWERLQSAIVMQDDKFAPNQNILRRIVAAAAIVLLVACTAAATYFITENNRAEQFYTCTAPYGSKTKVILPDHSIVWLNAGSTIRYSTLFNNDNRNVQLDGEGYFEVAKHDGKTFTVKTSNYDVVVKGTKFDVSSYKEDNLATVALMQGSVLVDRNDNHIMMKPGELVTLNKSTGILTKNRYTGDSRAWIDNMTDFDEITLFELAKVLSRQYGVYIHVQDQELGRSKFSVSLRNKETVYDVLDALQVISKMKIRRDGKNIYILK